jgi:hypothetical protein
MNLQSKMYSNIGSVGIEAEQALKTRGVSFGAYERTLIVTRQNSPVTVAKWEGGILYTIKEGAKYVPDVRCDKRTPVNDKYIIGDYIESTFTGQLAGYSVACEDDERSIPLAWVLVGGLNTSSGAVQWTLLSEVSANPWMNKGGIYYEGVKAKMAYSVYRFIVKATSSLTKVPHIRELKFFTA